ncbi:hypothetical protein CMI41_04475 [Candidatus Pacearchaeota archaeon]|nr:hypothetical protein [Candidatus Pacearchaeota archaeon]|tara:strand:- start:1985 stop:2554 length:570 start_codon:yes stop_codon:yes gene_type:complete
MNNKRQDDLTKKEKRGITNLVTLSRIFFALISVGFLAFDKTYLAISFFTIGYLTDKLDGTLARKFKIKSKMGNLLDSAADRIFQIIIVLALIFLGKLPLFFTIFLCFFMLGEVLFGIVMTRKLGKFYLFVNHRLSAKITSFMGFVTFGSIILDLPFQIYFIYILLLSLVVYAIDHIRLLVKNREKELLK